MGKTTMENAGINLSPYAGEGYQLFDMASVPKAGIDYKEVENGKSGEPKIIIDKSFDEVQADYENAHKFNAEALSAGIAGLGLLGGTGNQQVEELGSPPPFVARLPMVNFAASNPLRELYKHKNYAEYLRGY